MPSLTWIGKDAVLNHHLDVPYRVLEKKYTFSSDDSLSCHSERSEESQNKIIHGDNLEALKSLLPEYEGRVKCIYIDPPYNTGNENWVYNDNVNSPKIKKWLGQVVGKESEDLTRHDKWLCMMYPRLKLLQKLLSNDGAIFISIDDNEQANLKLVCDEIFGAGNFVGDFIWEKKKVVQNDSKFSSVNHEYVLSYRKSEQLQVFNLLPRTEEANARYANPDNDPNGPWTSVALTAKSGSADNIYDYTFPNGIYWKPNEGAYPRLSKDSLIRAYEENRLWFGKDGKNVPRLKKYLSEVKQGMVTNSILYNEIVGSTQLAKEQLKRTLGKNVFDTPKSIKLIEMFLVLATDKSSIILDSFAGSGTTAHAVLNLNKQDGGNRKFILVEMEDYAETITAERVRRVIDGYGGEGKNAVEGTGGSFSYYELGPELLKDGFINEDVPEQTIREYLYYTETNHALPQSNNGHPAHLGNFEGVAYYFLYNKDETTTLDATFLASISEKADRYVIYADNCTMPQKFLFDHDITFKKIPRDIRRF